MQESNEMKLTIASLNLNSCNSVFDDRMASCGKNDTKKDRIEKAIKEYKTVNLWALQEISVENQSSNADEKKSKFFDLENYHLLLRTIRLKTYKRASKIVNKVWDYKLDGNGSTIFEEIFECNSKRQEDVPETDYNNTVEFERISKNAIMTGFLCEKELIDKDKTIIDWGNNANVPKELIENCKEELINHSHFYNEEKEFPTQCISAVNYKFQKTEIKIINIHIPANEKNRYIVFNTLHRYLDKSKEQNIVLIGDFNLYKKSDEYKDCNNIMSDTTTTCTALLDKLEGLGFEEIRTINESDSGHYTHLDSNKNGSRYSKKLDHIYVSKSVSDNFKCSVNYVDDVNFDRDDIDNDNKEWYIEPFTDHSLIIAEISIK